MNVSYTTFAALSFGPVIAEVREDFSGKLTTELRRRCAARLNLSAAALAAAFREAEAILAAPKEGGAK